MNGDPLRQDESEYQRKPSRTKEFAKRQVKRKVRNYVGVKILALIGGSTLFGFLLIVIIIFAGMFFLTSQQEEKYEYGTWDVGGITSFGKNEIPADYIPIYKAAGEKYDVPWNLLAGVHRVETVFSTIGNMTSPVGAIGHMQFMPLTWLGWSYPGDRLGNANVPKSILTSPAKIKEYGGYGRDANGDGKADPYDLEDAIHSAAYYLSENGIKDGNIRKAVFAYNHADWYVEEVLGFADAYVSGYREVKNSPKPLAEIIDGISWPAPGIKGISSDYGYRTHPVTGEKTSFHAGIDFSLPGSSDLGMPIVAFRSGVVKHAGWKGTLGKAVIIDHGDGMESSYGHLNKIRISKGAKVESGQRVGDLGTTGRSTGPHLHFSVRINGDHVNPKKYLKAFLN